MKKIIIGLKNLNKETYKLIKYGLFFSICISFIASFILITYIFSRINVYFYIGLTLIKSSFAFSVQSIICGIIIDSLKKQLI